MSKSLLPALAALALATPVRSTASEDGVVLVELFTSEGCSSCPPADAVLRRLVDEPPPGVKVIALGEHVDYWDQLGWKDAFSSSVVTRRQEAYSDKLGIGSLFTPQLVVAGRTSLVGGNEAAARAAIAAAARERVGRLELSLSRSSDASLEVHVAAACKAGVAAETFMALVQDRATTRVTRGENAGRTLEHVAVVRALRQIGSGTGSYDVIASLPRPLPPGADRLVVFVQASAGGPICAATALPLPSASPSRSPSSVATSPTPTSRPSRRPASRTER